MLKELEEEAEEAGSCSLQNVNILYFGSSELYAVDGLMPDMQTLKS